MGLRGELFSTKVVLQNRTYFFNVKENRLGDLYLNIVESKNREEGGFERQSVILFADDLQDFLQGFDDALHVLEKAVREKRRETPNREPKYKEQRDREPRSNEHRYEEPKYKEQRNNEQRASGRRFKEPGGREQSYREQRNNEPRDRGFKKTEYDRKPPPRQSFGRKPREDSYAGKPRRNEGSDRDHSSKRVVVKHRKPRTDE
jgi:hypothetical protein